MVEKVFAVVRDYGCEGLSRGPANGFLTEAEARAYVASMGGEMSWEIVPVTIMRFIPAVLAPASLEHAAPRRRGLSTGPRAIAEIVRDHLRETGGTVTRKQILELLAARGITLDVADPSKHVGTIMWRWRNWFERNEDGAGFRLKAAEGAN